jgi:hypothetical protein
VAVALSVGCNKPADKPESGPAGKSDGIHISLPGVDVKVGNGGVKVKAPGTDVNVGPEGVKVDAPNTKVRLDPDRVDVEAPGTRVHSERKDTPAEANP